MVHVKGMQDVIAARNPGGTPGQASYAEIGTRLARLDHQRLLLERQFAMWSNKKEAARRRIAALVAQIADLERKILETRPHSQSGLSTNATSQTRSTAPVLPLAAVSIMPPTASRRREISFEY
ncbi:MAG: hypothetical protein ACLPID_21915 [Beijerinckiaceae bacterium]